MSTKKDLYRQAAEVYQSFDFDGAFGDFEGDEELADKVHREIVAWLRKKAGIKPPRSIADIRDKVINDGFIQ